MKKILLLLALAAALLVVFWGSKQKNHQPGLYQPKTPAAEPSQPVFIRLVPSRWIIPASISRDQASLRHFSQISRTLLNTIYQGLDRYSIVPEVEEMSKMFKGRMDVTFYDVPTQGCIPIYSGELKPAVLFFCMYPKEALPTFPFPITIPIFYPEKEISGRDDAIFMMGVNYQDSLCLLASCLHEMRHAYHQLNGINLELSLEEAQAHLLEEKILNLGTNGRYAEKIQSEYQKLLILKQQLTIDSLFNLPLETFANIDSLFAPANIVEHRIRNAQYSLSFISHHLQREHGEKFLPHFAAAYKKLRAQMIPELALP